MDLFVLGAHQLESLNTRCTTILIDGVLALDGSSLSSTLSLADQANVRYILLTHYHYDHIKDIATLGFNTASQGTTLVVCSPAVQEALLSHILNGRIWPRLDTYPSADQPTIRFVTIEPGEWLSLERYRVLSFPVPHAVPTMGFIVVGGDNCSLFYSSDTGPGWAEAASAWLPQDIGLIITEVTMPNELVDIALRSGHLTPELLRNELRLLGERLGRIPRVLIVHIHPGHEAAIRTQLASVAADLQADIAIGQEGMRLAI